MEEGGNWIQAGKHTQETPPNRRGRRRTRAGTKGFSKTSSTANVPGPGLSSRWSQEFEARLKLPEKRLSFCYAPVLLCPPGARKFKKYWRSKTPPFFPPPSLLLLGPGVIDEATGEEKEDRSLFAHTSVSTRACYVLIAKYGICKSN